MPNNSDAPVSGLVERLRTAAERAGWCSDALVGHEDNDGYLMADCAAEADEDAKTITEAADHITATDTLLANRETQLRMIISHASGGHLSEPGDIDRSTNDICVQISAHKNEIWKHAQEVATAKADTLLAELREALRRCERLSMIDGADQDDEHGIAKERDQALDALADIRGLVRATLNPSPTDKTT